MTDAPAPAQLFDPLATYRNGSLQGHGFGSEVTVLTFETDTPGAGPGLHKHPYGETFIVLDGLARFHVGDAVVEAAAGQMVVAPPQTPHRFENVGPETLRTVAIHHSPNWVQTDL